MDFHPIIVHFPVALLTCYAVSELFRFRIIRENSSWFWIQASFLLVGSAGSLVAYKTGEWASEGMKSVLVSAHARFAKITVILFGLLALLYVVRILSEWFGASFSVLMRITSMTERMRKSFLMPIAALVGLATVTITGALGGAIVYGPDVDPFVSIIYNLVIK